jgi:uncharacterized DUF497 family protein
LADLADAQLRLSGGTGVDTGKFFAITHADHVVCNPTSIGKLDERITLLDLLPGLRTLDVGCGKGEGSTIRIISARKATTQEVRDYEEGI